MKENVSSNARELEKPELRISFIPIICSAPLIYAHSHGFFAKNGLKVTLRPAPGWSGIKELMVHGLVDAVHMLSPMPLACRLGIDGRKADIRLATIQNVNGQALTLARKHVGIKDVRDMKGFTFGVPYRFSMHYYLLCYFLAENGINPIKDVAIKEVAPPRMPYYLEKGWVDGVFAPEPFNQIPVYRGSGFIYVLSKDIWPSHPCCSFATSQDFIDRRPNTYRVMLKSVLEAELALHKADVEQRRAIAREISGPEHLNQEDSVPVEQALSGDFPDGKGRHCTVPDRIDFIPYPWEEYGSWMVSQMQRWAQLPGRIDYREVVQSVFDEDTRELAEALGFDKEEKPRLEGIGFFTGVDPFRYMQQQPFCAFREQREPLEGYGLSGAARERVSEIIRRMAEVAGGELDTEIQVTADDEIGVLEQILGETILNMKFAREAIAEHADRLNQRVEERTAELASANQELKREVAERQQAEERARHLNAVLLAIRNVNQLISRERNRDRLLQGVCDSLSEARGYRSCWVALLDDSRRLITAAEAGLGDDFQALIEQMKRGELNNCGVRALSLSGALVIDDPSAVCGVCALGKGCGSGKAMAARLEYRGDVYGLMVASIRENVSVDREEQALFEEVTGDVAFALHGIREEEDRKRAELALREAHGELERRVDERTAELERANANLQREVAERKQAEQTLRESEAVYLSLVESLPLNVLRKDLEGRVVFGNQRYCETLGHPLHELVGKTDFDLFPRGLAEKYRSDDATVIATGEVMEIIEEHVKPDGEMIYVQVLKAPVCDADGKIVGMQGMFWDVTARERAAEAVRTAKEAAEAASRAKSDFLANMSHEIRTPMNAIIGMTELVLDTELGASQRDYLKMIRESGESLMSVINDVLDFSKIEAGKLDLESAPFDLREGLGDTMKSLALRAHSKGLELACQIPPQVPDRLVGDVGRLRQIVVNLVGNAIKFTEVGEVVLVVQRQSHSEDEVVLRFAVTDTGIGIAEEKRAAVFDAFEQADGSTTRRHGGTGLGLAISSRLVQLMGGQIWVESEVGRGSTFHFTAPFGLARGEAAEAAPAQPTIVQDTRVLVVDDNATNRCILEEMLRNWGMDPTVVPGGHDALRLLRKARESGEPYRVVLSDANMPEMDGFTLAEEIKRRTELDNTIIMMLTSGDRPGDISRCEKLGIAAYLLKPIKQSELFDAIVMALGVTSLEDEGAERLAVDRTCRLRPLRVLLAEDSLVNQRLAVGLLEKYGHTVVVANHGREAIAALESQEFDLVLMDVQMPEIDGYEATAVIRAKEKQAGTHIPIIAMTAHAMKGDRERCLEAGMDDYVAKPVRAKQLFETIEALLGTATEPSVRPDHTPLEEEMVDWPEALRTVEGDRELLRDMVEGFLEESPKLMAAVCQAVAQSAADDLQKAAHTLRGAVRCFGEGRALEGACQLEKMAQDGNLETAEETLTALQREMARLIPVLVDYVRGNSAAKSS
ncbi:MAG: ABC transporter substrate-binding protein [Planctomycetota bacterium]|jgi:PAS domain S-box-containing protein